MIVITGATGKLGHHVVTQLLNHVPAAELAVAVRNPSKAHATYGALGIEIRQGDYAEPQSWPAALAGAHKVLLISSSEVGQRATQHQTVIDAAKAAGVQLLAYTSILHADRSGLALAAEHQQTEAALRASGVPSVVLRNGWYLENYSENLQAALTHGAWLGSAGNGRIAAAARADFAAAAVAVLTTAGHAGKVYELAGDQAFTLSELAAMLSKLVGKSIVYQDMPASALQEVLVGAGLPAGFAHILADADVGISRGELDDTSGDLRRLIGRPTTTLATALAAALKA
jgi:NAD(P)H dehydrogenase (quinone)